MATMAVENPPGVSDLCAMLGPVQTVSVSPVFIGRAGELEELTGALARAAAGTPQALVIGGEAGVGKTRLLEEFLAAAEAAGATTAVGACLEIGADGLPYASIVTALRCLHRQLGPELERIAAGREGELARLLPDLGEVTGEARGSEGRGRLFELTVDLLERLSEKRTIVLAVEDLHWAERSTRDLLAFLFRTVQRGRLLIVATYRADDIHRRHPLRPFLAELDRLRSVDRIELSRFTRDEVAGQLAGILGAEPEYDLVTEVYARSEGNAFFVEELVCTMGCGCETGISDSLRDLLLVRVEALPEAAQRVVRVVAEAGSHVEYPLLEAVAGLPEDDLLEALRAAVGANILLPTRDADGYRFRHALVREAVTDDLLPGERSRLNRRYAQALEAAPNLVSAEECAARLASYWYWAHDADKALPAVLRAAANARRRSAYTEQLGLLERAMELWEAASPQTRQALRAADGTSWTRPSPGHYPRPDTDDGQGPLRYLDLLGEAVVAAHRGGAKDRAHTLCKRALRLIDHEQDPQGAAWFWIRRSTAVTALKRGDGREELLKARELVEGLPPSAVQADVLGRLAAWDSLHGTEDESSLRTCEEAVRLAREVGAVAVELHARVTLAMLHAHLGSPRQAVAEIEQVVADAEEFGDADVLARAHVDFSALLEATGQSVRAAQVARSAAGLTERHGLPRDTGAFILGNLVEALISTGEWEEARRQLRRARQWAQIPYTQGCLETYEAELALLAGDVARAEQYAEQARQSLGAIVHRPQNAIPLADLAVRIARRTGRFAAARSHLLAVLAEGFAPGMEEYAWPLLFHGAQAEGDSLGLPGSAEGRAEALERIAAAAGGLRVSEPVWQAWAYLVEAELSRARGESAPALWERAVAAVEPVRPYLQAVARYRWAEALLAAGERGCAVEPLACAAAVAGRLGAAHLGREIRLLAERARIPLEEQRDERDRRDGERRSGGPEQAAAEAVEPVDGLGLTRREQEVLRLVAEGRSNRQIAEALFISPKTASVHVSNILAKLGVGGRGEAAALAHRLGFFAGAGTGPAGAGPARTGAGGAGSARGAGGGEELGVTSRRAV
jgi:DNA-binding CsgD family transcriptional regulator/tetratricopeptide (TPR) repeat protein